MLALPCKIRFWVPKMILQRACTWHQSGFRPSRLWGVAGVYVTPLTEADSGDENEMNNATPIPTSSEMKIIMKCMRSYLNAHFNGGMNNKMDDIKQFLSTT
ncbi:hypothetical protein TNCV_94721 [Trichonephila clavipes]|nr:hypothetical protein TNCV_94721 [Trichonephila clavipes]